MLDGSGAGGYSAVVVTIEVEQTRIDGGRQNARLGRLPIRSRAYMSCARWGHVAEWLRNGLQNRVHQFNSGRGLHPYNQ